MTSSIPRWMTMGLLCAASAAAAAEPVLLFSDLTSGPKAGLGDGLGEGAIVTVWGMNLGPNQGSSTISLGGSPAAHVYYWGNADGSPLAGPADLYTSHRMQVIAFSISSGATDGPGSIEVVVNAARSNALSFTVRAGGLYFVKTTGIDQSGDGSWTNPWKTLEYVGNRAGRKIAAGDTVYAGDGVVEDSSNGRDGLAIGFSNRDLNGTADRPISLVAYPGARVIARGNSNGIGNYNADSSFFSFAKFVVQTGGGGIGGFKGMRAIGNEITNLPGGCADGQAGAIYAPGYGTLGGKDLVSGIRALGNYIHHFGCDTTSKLHHVFYLTNRTGFPKEAYELGWNHLRDNKAHHALHNYDESICGDFTGTLRIHDNVVVNQVGACVGVGSGGNDPCLTMDVEISNNLFVNCGLEIPTCSGHNYAVGLSGDTTHSHIRFFNNTLVGYGGGAPGGFALETRGYRAFAGTLDWVNNLVVDTHDLPYFQPGTGNPVPALVAGNLWNPGGNQVPAAAPSWDPSALVADPRFADAAVGDFRLLSNSPAIDGGSSVVAGVVARDLDGNLRPLGGGFDIGAYEFTPACAQSADCIHPPPCRSAAGATCSTGACSYPAVADGTSCPGDFDACTEDVCRAGLCTHPPLTGGCGDGGQGGVAGGTAGDAGSFTDGGGTEVVGTPDAGGDPPVAQSCHCGSAASGPASWLWAGACLLIGVRARRRRPGMR